MCIGLTYHKVFPFYPIFKVSGPAKFPILLKWFALNHCSSYFFITTHSHKHMLSEAAVGQRFGMCGQWAPNCFLLIQIEHQRLQHFIRPPMRSATLGLFITLLTPQLDPSYLHILHTHLHRFTYPCSLSMGFNWGDVPLCALTQWRWRTPLWG